MLSSSRTGQRSPGPRSARSCGAAIEQGRRDCRRAIQRGTEWVYPRAGKRSSRPRWRASSTRGAWRSLGSGRLPLGTSPPGGARAPGVWPSISPSLPPLSEAANRQCLPSSQVASGRFRYRVEPPAMSRAGTHLVAEGTVQPGLANFRTPFWHRSSRSRESAANQSCSSHERDQPGATRERLCWSSGECGSGGDRESV